MPDTAIHTAEKQLSVGKRFPKYPALTAWRCRKEHPRKFGTWTFDDLWRCACAEKEASERQDPEREQALQREAIAILLDVPVRQVKLNSTWTRRYVARLAEIASKEQAA